MMRSKFDEQLNLLNKELIMMGALCENAIAMAGKALLEGDVELASRVKGVEEEIDRKESQIESLCLRLLLQQQPVAHDLRIISSALKMITDMERIGDQSADIAEIIRMGNISASQDTFHIGEMARATIKMVNESVEAFVKQDIELAKAVIRYDDVVDDLFNRVKAELLRQIGKMDSEYALDLLMIAKYFERIGDHAVNVSEWVVFAITGRHKGDALT